MDGQQFDAHVQRLTQVRLTRLDALRGLIASAAAGLTGATLIDDTDAKRAGKKGGKKKAKGKHKAKQAHNKVTHCHKPGTPDQATITVAKSQAKRYLNHGDTAGACATTPPPPSVCSGKNSPNPCFELDADTCGGTPGGRSCRCGADINGNLACYENAYCNNPVSETPCASNADCVARGFPTGSVCFSAEFCCGSAPGVPATGCTTPCPAPSA